MRGTYRILNLDSSLVEEMARISLQLACNDTNKNATPANKKKDIANGGGGDEKKKDTSDEMIKIEKRRKNGNIIRSSLAIHVFGRGRYCM